MGFSCQRISSLYHPALWCLLLHQKNQYKVELLAASKWTGSYHHKIWVTLSLKVCVCLCVQIWLSYDSEKEYRFWCKLQLFHFPRHVCPLPLPPNHLFNHPAWLTVWTRECVWMNTKIYFTTIALTITCYGTVGRAVVHQTPGLVV